MKKPKIDTRNDGVLPLARSKEIAESREARIARRNKKKAKVLFNPKVRQRTLENAAKARFFKVKVLTTNQLKAIELLCDFMNNWSTEYICGQCNINIATLYSWRNDPFFIRELDREISRRRTSYRTEALRHLFKKIKKGNPRMIITYFKMIGELTDKIEDVTKDKNDIDSMNETELDAEIAKRMKELGLSDPS